MAKGLPKWAIKAARKMEAKNVFATAWRIVRKKKGLRAKPLKRARRKTKVRRKRRVARRRRRRRGGFSIQRTLFKFIRIAPLIAVPAFDYTKRSGTPLEKGAKAILGFAGLADHHRPIMQFSWKRLATYWTPFIIVNLMTTLVPKINGIIRRL